MSAVIPFNEGAVPAFLRNAQVNNEDLTANVGSGFPVLSVKGKTWALVKGGERKVLTRDIDGEAVPTNSVEVVILKANKHLSKIYYAKGYSEGDVGKPDCYSNSGDAPEKDAESPQAKSCAMCKHNQWGSKVSEDGKKLKACQDARRVAVAAAGRINEPMLLRIPPASLRPLHDYAQMLGKRGVGYNAVVTKIKFDPDAATPKLVFEAKAFVSEEQFEQVQEAVNDPMVEQIVAVGVPFADEFDTPKPAHREIPPAAEVAAPEKVKEVETPKPKKVKPEPVTVQVISDSSELDDLLSSIDALGD
jgi:hypothetical protein